MSKLKLSGSRILITGASSGIGEATAREAARRGADVVLVARREKELKRVAREIETETGKVPLVLVGDITNPKHRVRIVRAMDRSHLNILVNNAGITAHGRFDQT